MKEALVAKVCLPGGPSVYQLAKDSGISPVTLHRWVETMGLRLAVGNKRKSVDWSAQQKLDAISGTRDLDTEELGRYLREHGLHSRELEEWRKEALACFTPAKRGRPRKDPELLAAQEENKILKRDLRRKDRALAEQMAIVILQKKAKILWGQCEDDESN